MKHVLQSFSASASILMARLMSKKLGTWVIGSSYARLTLGAAIAPLAGYYGGLSSVILVGIASWLLQGSFSLAGLALVVPGMVGGLCMARQLKRLHVLFFVGAALVFWTHPVGAAAWAYPLLWLVPSCLLLVRQRSIFIQALVSTYVVHAVGACLWLYTVPMNSVQWIAMMPQVFVERMLYALAMTAVIMVIDKIQATVLVRHKQVVMES